jgi:3-oxo-5alpha-steroid 4-dehydrogenase
VVYAGAGTTIQEAAGLRDTPENMFNYLSQEGQGVVSDATLRRFCETSPAMIAWLQRQGARYRGTLCPYKLKAEPAARGHRMVAKGMSSGHAFFQALRASAESKGVEFKPLSRVHEVRGHLAARHGRRRRLGDR